MIFAVAQGAVPSLAQWLAIGAVMVGVVLVPRSGDHYEVSSHLPPGKLRIVLGLALLASVCLAVSLTAGQAAAPIFGDVQTVWLARCFGLGAIGIVFLASPGKAAIPMRWLPVLRR